MTARDPHRFVNEIDDAAVDRLVAGLESRAKDKVFTKLFDRYARQLDLSRPPGYWKSAATRARSCVVLQGAAGFREK